MENLINLSRFISLILRHKPGEISIKLDKNGYADVNELINGINNNGKYNINFDILKYIVDTDDKQRYSFNNDFTKIRANQGHSIKVDVKLEECKPPKMLYHGTGEKYLDSIKLNGLISKSRLYVHLSDDYNTAISVGERHGKPVVLYIDSYKMYKDGYKFYLSKNNVWLTTSVPKEYIKREVKKMRNDVKQEFERLIKTQNDKKIELNKTYWVSEWSWNPIADGYITQPEVIRYKETIDGINIYTTGTSYRYYYAWDLYESEEDCKKMSDFKDRFAYGWCETEYYIPHDKIKNILK